MLIDQIKKRLRELTKHDNVAIVNRGDAAIKAVLKQFNNILIPSEGGWISYKKLPKYFEEVVCDNSRLNLNNLKKKLEEGKMSGVKFDAILYQNPGGYFTQQPIKEIYLLCRKYNCKVIMDVTGGIGTKLCDGDYADFMVCSFGKWKLIDVGKGGFLSCKQKEDFSKLDLEEFTENEVLMMIDDKLNLLDERINFLLNKRAIIIDDLKEYDVLYPNNLGFVIVIEFSTKKEKENLINYCEDNNLSYTQCPRYIRVNKQAISIEIKRLEK